MCSGDGLRQADVFGLQTLRSLLHNERDPRPFIERTISASGDGGKMDEDVIAIFALDKAKPFSCVKPLHGSCFFHVSSVPAIPGFLTCQFEYRAEVMLNFTSTFKRIQTMREDFKSAFKSSMTLSTTRRNGSAASGRMRAVYSAHGS